MTALPSLRDLVDPGARPTPWHTRPEAHVVTRLEHAQVDAAVRDVLALAERVFGLVEQLRSATVDSFSATRPAAPSHRALPDVEPVATGALLANDALVVGAGFVAAPGALSDEDYWLEWWTGTAGPERTAARLVVETDPEAPTFRNYTTLPWFDIPRRTERRHITGPYVDYLCTDEYTLTFTAPVSVESVFVGVTGADVYTRTVELLLAEQLEEIPQPAAVVNAQGRVVVGNSGAPVTGELVRAVPDRWTSPISGAGGVRVHRCGTLPLAVATGL